MAMLHPALAAALVAIQVRLGAAVARVAVARVAKSRSAVADALLARPCPVVDAVRVAMLLPVLAAG